MMFGVGLVMLASVWMFGVLASGQTRPFDWVAAHILLVAGAIEIVGWFMGGVR